jgi:hypothetical protein
MRKVITEESGEPLGGMLAADTIAIFIFEHAVNLAVGLTHVNRNGETLPTDSSKRDGRRRIVEQFWKLADSELWPRSA